MSEEDDRSFERWALAGAVVLAASGIAAFLLRHDAPELASTGDEAESGDVLRVQIGGPRPPPEAAPDAPEPQVVPDPGAGPAEEPRQDEDASTPPRVERTVVVQPGETLGQIAQRELGTIRRLPEIVELNGIEHPDRVRAGTVLRLPPR